MGCKSVLDSKDELLLTLLKLRLGLTHQDLGDRFKIVQSTVSVIFKSWIPLNSIGKIIV